MKISNKITKNFVASPNIQKSLQSFYDHPVLRVSLELVLSIIVVAVFALFALRPTLLTMANLLQEIDEKQKMAALATAQSEWSAYKGQVEELQRAFFNEPSLEDVLVYLEYFARQQSVIVTGMTAPEIAVQLDDNGEAQSTGLLALVPYESNFQVVCDFEGILGFLQQVEKQQPLISVEALQLSMGDEESAVPMSATFRLRVYVQQTAAEKSQAQAAKTPGKETP